MSEVDTAAGEPSPTEEETVVVANLLASFGLEVPWEEVRLIAASWSTQRAATNVLYDCPEAKYAEPALRFRADADAVEWTG